MSYRKSSRRWIAGVVLVGAATAGLYLATRGGGHASSARAAAGPHRAVPVPQLAVPHAAPAMTAVVAPVAPVEPEHIPLQLGKGDASPSVAKWKEPGLPGTFREIVAPDDGENTEEELTYRLRRLRFTLTDAASNCYQGADSKEQIDFSYSIHVQGGAMTTRNVRVLSSTISDSQVQDCLTDALVHLRAPAPEMPDVDKEQTTSIQLHDLVDHDHNHT